MFRELECRRSARLLEQRKAEKGDFFPLDEIMDDGAPRAGAELVADAPLTSLCTHMQKEHTHMQRLPFMFH